MVNFEAISRSICLLVVIYIYLPSSSLANKLATNNSNHLRKADTANSEQHRESRSPQSVYYNPIHTHNRHRNLSAASFTVRGPLLGVSAPSGEVDLERESPQTSEEFEAEQQQARKDSESVIADDLLDRFLVEHPPRISLIEDGQAANYHTQQESDDLFHPPASFSAADLFPQENNLETNTTEDARDRYIQYDTFNQTTGPTSNGQQQKLHTRQTSHSETNEGQRLSNYKMMESLDEEDTDDRRERPSTLANYTLNKGTTRPLLANKTSDSAPNESFKTSDKGVASAVTDSGPADSGAQVTDASSNGTSSLRSGNMQARSMSAISQAANKTPQLTRPPYATYDQFQQRTGGEQVEQQQAEANYDLTATSVAAPASSKNASESQSLVNSMSRISSQLVSSDVRDAARGSGLRSKQPERELAGSEKQLHKLSSSLNQLVDLSPLMSGAESNRDQESSQDRFYFSKDNQLFNFYPQQSQQQRERFSSVLDSNEIAKEASSKAHDSRYQLADPLISAASMQVSSQLQESPHQQQILASNSLLPEAHELLQSDRHQSGLIHQKNQAKHYAASLINVTAPMILPLSASEAMESALGEQGGKVMQQASGFLRPPMPSSGGGEKPSQVRQSQYFAPQALESQLQSIYSQPANQFSPKPPSNTNTNNNQQSLLDGLDLANSSSSFLEERMRLNRNSYILAGRRPSSTPTQTSSGYSAAAQPNATHQASGFRSPLQSGGATSSVPAGSASAWPSTRLPTLSSYLNGPLPAMQSQPATTFSISSTPSSAESASPNQTSASAQQARPPTTMSQFMVSPSAGSSGAASSQGPPISVNGSVVGAGTANPNDATGLNRRVFNLTRVEHISAECSNDLIRTVIIFNGTFKGIIYSSGYVRDPNCMYINGTGKTRYDFSIRLNQCGTLGRQELHPPVGPNEVRRRDQVMWNTLSIQYNPIIEQEWDEHFRVSCEYGSDFWKTVSFSPFNVETNTGSPVVFTVDPPQCQMEILKGHGMVGPRQEAVTGPVIVGDPLTLLIHMKSEKAGYDILVKNCIAHNGGVGKMQLIDSNGCVVNERFISPFRGTYNDNEMKHVTLYSYLKAFRFTGSPVLYLECEIHMCQSSCPPQMCYWRRLSKRSASNESRLTHDEFNEMLATGDLEEGVEPTTISTTMRYQNQPDGGGANPEEPIKIVSKASSRRRLRKLDLGSDDDENSTKTTQKPKTSATQSTGQISDKVSLFQALEVRQERADPDPTRPYSSYSTFEQPLDVGELTSSGTPTSQANLMCYRRVEVWAFLFTALSVILVAISVTVGCCWRAANLRKRDRKLLSSTPCLSSANLSSCGSSTSSSSPPASFSNNNNCRASSNLSASNYYQASTLLQSAPYHKAFNVMGPTFSHHTTRHKGRGC